MKLAVIGYTANGWIVEVKTNVDETGNCCLIRQWLNQKVLKKMIAIINKFNPSGVIVGMYQYGAEGSPII